eukprot:239122-Amphidinium_carterae.1
MSLPGKKKGEFHFFLEAIQPFSEVRLTAETSQFLSRWADEYGVDGLKKRCEDVLMQEPVTVDHLLHAVVCNLCRRVEQCYGTIIANIHDYIDDLAALGASFPPEILQRLWPTLCQAAGVEEDMP